MNPTVITAEATFKVEFYDVDPMRIVWHGNYVKYLEKARCALLDTIGYGYLDMKKSGYSFPVTGIKMKYIHSLSFGDTVRAKATLLEYENYIKIRYEIFNALTGVLTTKAESSQMAVEIKSGETQFVCPRIFIEKVESAIRKKEQEASKTKC